MNVWWRWERWPNQGMWAAQRIKAIDAAIEVSAASVDKGTCCCQIKLVLEAQDTTRPPQPHYHPLGQSHYSTHRPRPLHGDNTAAGSIDCAACPARRKKVWGFSTANPLDSKHYGHAQDTCSTECRMVVQHPGGLWGPTPRHAAQSRLCWCPWSILLPEGMLMDSATGDHVDAAAIRGCVDACDPSCC